jgi:hypothetical protein
MNPVRNDWVLPLFAAPLIRLNNLGLLLCFAVRLRGLYTVVHKVAQRLQQRRNLSLTSDVFCRRGALLVSLRVLIGRKD